MHGIVKIYKLLKTTIRPLEIVTIMAKTMLNFNTITNDNVNVKHVGLDLL
jgi:hypothetical protein